MFEWVSAWIGSIHEPLFSTLDLVVVSWIMMSVMVGYGASMERNRSFLAWYLVSFVLSPFLAAFILLRLPKEANPPIPAQDSKPDGAGGGPRGTRAT